MSVHWMSWVWKNGPDDPQRLLVLLKLADNANQDGNCWPSVAEICMCTRLSDSTVRRCISDLEKGGWLTVIRGCGRNKKSHYCLVENLSQRNLSQRTPSEKTPSQRQEKPVTVTKPPHPLIGNNHQEPPRVQEKESLPEWLDPILWAGWVEMRKRIPRAPFTDLARRSVLADLAKLKSYGKDPNERLEEGMKRGWRGVLFDSDKPVAAPPKPNVQWIDPETGKAIGRTQ